MIKLRPHQERIVKTMTHTTKGQVIVPTGGGKTMCMITDAHRQFQYGNQTIVVVALSLIHISSPRDVEESRMPSSA